METVDLSIDEAVQLTRDLYWVGSTRKVGGFRSNTYLLISGDQAVLINPGSPVLFREVSRKIRSILPIEKISYTVLLHPGPDEAGGIPYFRKTGFRGKIVTHSHTATIALHYGISSHLYLVDRHEYHLSLDSGRLLEFIPAPYLPSSGSLLMFDASEELLFSGNLFGGRKEELKIPAEETGPDEVKYYHRQVFPISEGLRQVGESLIFRTVSMICPQYGPVLAGETTRLIESLTEPQEETVNVLGEDNINRPGFLLSELTREKRKSLELIEEVQRLKQSNQSLQNNLDLTREAMIRDQMTGLYNEDFLVRYLLNIFNEEKWENLYALFIQVDNMRQLNQTVGEQKGDEIIGSVGGILDQEKRQEDYIFRVGGPVFVMIIPKDEHESIVDRAESLRIRIEEEPGFIEQISISLGIIPVIHEELKDLPAPMAMEQIFTTGRMLLGTAARKGGNRVESDLDLLERRALVGRVVIVEYDSFHAQLIGDSLETLSIDYRICLNGPEALSTILEFHPDVIISEVFLFETDVFNLKEDLQENTKTKDIPFILISHQKNDLTVARAVSLGIVHYLRKPYMLSELLGIIETYIQKALSHGS